MNWAAIAWGVLPFIAQATLAGLDAAGVHHSTILGTIAQTVAALAAGALGVKTSLAHQTAKAALPNGESGPQVSALMRR